MSDELHLGSDKEEGFSDEHFQAIGRLVVACSKLDAILTDLICGFAWIPEDLGIILVHHQNFSSKFDAFIAILGQFAVSPKSNQEVSEWIDSLSPIKEIYNYRNNVVHGLWSRSVDGNPEVRKYTSRRKLAQRTIAFPTQEILEKAEYAFDACENLLVLRERLYGLKPDAEIDVKGFKFSRLGDVAS